MRIPCIVAWIGLGLTAGCLSPETIQRIEGKPGQEGTGVFLARLPEVVRILTTYPASNRQREVADQRARAAVTQLREADLKGQDTDIPRVIAVDTQPDERAQGTKSVMLWDTQTEEILGNDVYDVESPPQLGDMAMWNNVSARYLGRGTTESL